MKSLYLFASQIITIRFLSIGLSLSQTTMWAAILGISDFGVASTYLAAQGLASLVGRLGYDNLLVRHYQPTESFKAQFVQFLVSTTLLSSVVGGLFILILSNVILDRPLTNASLLFIPFVLSVNVNTLLSRIFVAQRRANTATILVGVLPLAISVGTFALFTPHIESFPLSAPLVAITLLALGHAIAAITGIIYLRKFLIEGIKVTFKDGQIILSSINKEQWYFLGYQSLALFRGTGMILAVAALFDSTVTGLFSLALRIGGLLNYLNEPARMYAAPRVAGKAASQILKMYQKMVLMNVALGATGVILFAIIFVYVPLPFPIDPPLITFSLIILTAAMINLLVGPVGIILAMRGHEKNNFFANLAGISISVVSILIAALSQNAIHIVIGLALASITTNLINTLKLASIFRDGQKHAV